MGNPKHPGSLLNKHNRWGHRQHTTHTAQLDQTLLDCFSKCSDDVFSTRFLSGSLSQSFCRPHLRHLRLSLAHWLTLTAQFLFWSLAPTSPLSVCLPVQLLIQRQGENSLPHFFFFMLSRSFHLSSSDGPLADSLSFPIVFLSRGKNAPFSLFSGWKRSYFVRYPFLLWF